MNSYALILILSSVLLHATWNILSKSQQPRVSFYMLFSITILISTSPILIFSGIDLSTLPKQTLICILGGGFFGMLGNVGFSYAYLNTDISLAYPIARALPILFTALVAQFLGLEKLDFLQILGMIIIFVGCLVVPLYDIKNKSINLKGFLGILLVAVAISGYTIFDTYGMKSMQEFAHNSNKIVLAGTYYCMRESVITSLLLIFVLSLKGQRQYLTKKLFSSFLPYLTGFLAGLTYFLVLIAMIYIKNVSYIPALRQMSLPICAILGIIFLKEKITIPKIITMLMVLAGLILICH